MIYNRSQLEAGRLVWLLEIKLRGKAYRFSTDIIEVMSGDTTHGNASKYYAAGLEFLDYEDTVGIMEASASDRSVSVSVTFQGGQQEGWTSLTDTSRDAGQATGELSLLLVGETFKNRRVIVSGFIDSMVYGGQNEPVEFTITQSDFIDPSMIPSEMQEVTASTFPTRIASSSSFFGDGHTVAPDDQAIGQFYPIIFGQPGTHCPNGWRGWVKGGAASGDRQVAALSFDASPGLVVEIDQTRGNNHRDRDPEDTGVAGEMSAWARILIAGHECAAMPALTATIAPSYGASNLVHVYHEDFGHVVKTVYQDVDGYGQPYSYVALHESEHVSPYGMIELGAELWIGWSGAGGVLNEDRTGPRLGAGEIIEYLLEQSSLNVDSFANRQPLSEVDHYVLDFWINEPRSPWDVISEDILPLLPLSSYASERGVGFVYWNWDATASDAVEKINIQKNMGERLGPVEVSSIDQIYNKITINYCRTGSDGGLKKSLTYQHEDSPKSYDYTRMFNVYSYASYTRYGVREAPIVMAPVVERDETARAILDWMIRYYSQTRRTVRYQLAQKYQALELGSVVTLTDSEIAFDNQVCLVSGIVRAPGLTEITLTTVPHWAIDPKV
mgnify:FL=1|tara:strand:- start:2073 stop:3908 length:1836 start_codon:yes stop_codon:yes gene_type:complete